MDITYRNRRALIATLPTVEQPQPDEFDTHEYETRVLEINVAYDDGAAIFSGPRRRGYYLHGTVVVIERRPGSGFIGRKFALYKSGRKALIAEAARYSEKQLHKHAEAVAGSGLVKAVVMQTLDLTGFTLPSSPELAALFLGADPEDFRLTDLTPLDAGDQHELPTNPLCATCNAEQERDEDGVFCPFCMPCANDPCPDSEEENNG